ncbi:MAG: hypothetical protein WBK46_12000 [Ruminococcus flavefaciens]
MKRFISIVLAGVMTAVSVTFSSPTVTAEAEHHYNVLITYFSRAGENYNVGVVERGNTDLLAGIVAEVTGEELFRIETVKEYPTAYDEMLTIATEERTNKERPELKTSIENFDTYDVIFVGYPILVDHCCCIVSKAFSIADFSETSGYTICNSRSFILNILQLAEKTMGNMIASVS